MMLSYATYSTGPHQNAHHLPMPAGPSYYQQLAYHQSYQHITNTGALSPSSVSSLPIPSLTPSISDCMLDISNPLASATNDPMDAPMPFSPYRQNSFVPEMEQSNNNNNNNNNASMYHHGNTHNQQHTSNGHQGRWQWPANSLASSLSTSTSSAFSSPQRASYINTPNTNTHNPSHNTSSLGLYVSLPPPPLPSHSYHELNRSYLSEQQSYSSSSPASESSSSLSDATADNIFIGELPALDSSASDSHSPTVLTSPTSSPIMLPSISTHPTISRSNSGSKRKRTRAATSTSTSTNNHQSTSSSPSLSSSDAVMDKEELKKQKHREIDAARRARETAAVSRLQTLITQVEESAVIPEAQKTLTDTSSTSASTSRAAITQQSSSSPPPASSAQKADKKDKVGILEVAADKLVELESLCSQLQQGLQTEKEKTKQLEALLMAPQRHQQQHKHHHRLRSSTQYQLQRHAEFSGDEDEDEDASPKRVRIRDPFKRPPAAISSSLIQSYHASVYSSTFLHSSAAMLVLSIQSGQCVDVNQQFCQLSGWSREQVLGRFFTDTEGKNHQSECGGSGEHGMDDGPSCSAVLDESFDSDDEEEVVAGEVRLTDKQTEYFHTSVHDNSTPTASTSVLPRVGTSDVDADDGCPMTVGLTMMNNMYHQKNSTDTDTADEATKNKEVSLMKMHKHKSSKLLELYTGKRSIIRIRYRLKNGYGVMVDYMSRCWLGYAENELGESVATYLIVQTFPVEPKKNADKTNDSAQKTAS